MNNNILVLKFETFETTGKKIFDIILQIKGNSLRILSIQLFISYKDQCTEHRRLSLIHPHCI